MKKHLRSEKNYFNKEFLKHGFFSPTNIKFVIYSEEIWDLAKRLLSRSKKVVDLGCGGGTVLYNVSQITKAELIGVDFSEEAIYHTSKKVPSAKLLQRDVSSTPLSNNYCDFCISTMVIEHLESDEDFLDEIERILKPSRYLLISTVLKKKGAWYFYKNKKGERVLEPTHLREYYSLKNFLDLLRKKNFKIVLVKTSKISFPLIDPLIKVVFHSKSFFWKKLLERRLIEFLRIITRVPIPGYYAIELIAQKKSR